MNRAKRLWALLTCLALLTTLTLPAAAEGAVFTINSPEDWAEFVRLSTRDVWSQGMTVELNADLDLSDSGSTPVPIFQGTFHGNGAHHFRCVLQPEGLQNWPVPHPHPERCGGGPDRDGTLEPQGTASSVGLLAGENYGTIRRCSAQGNCVRAGGCGRSCGSERRRRSPPGLFQQRPGHRCHQRRAALPGRTWAP